MGSEDLDINTTQLRWQKLSEVYRLNSQVVKREGLLFYGPFKLNQESFYLEDSSIPEVEVETEKETQAFLSDEEMHCVQNKHQM